MEWFAGNTSNLEWASTSMSSIFPSSGSAKSTSSMVWLATPTGVVAGHGAD